MAVSSFSTSLHNNHVLDLKLITLSPIATESEYSLFVSRSSVIVFGQVTGYTIDLDKFGLHTTRDVIHLCKTTQCVNRHHVPTLTFNSSISSALFSMSFVSCCMTRIFSSSSSFSRRISLSRWPISRWISVHECFNSSIFFSTSFTQYIHRFESFVWCTRLYHYIPATYCIVTHLLMTWECGCILSLKYLFLPEV